MNKETELPGATVDRKLKDPEYIKLYGWGKIISYLKRQFDFWANDQLGRRGYKHFKMAYMPVLMNISTDEGTSNNDLAKVCRVTKQAMSKVLKELTKYGYIKTKVDPLDKRSSIIMLTDKGKKFVIDARSCMKDLMQEYRDVIGAKDFDHTLQLLVKIIEYNDMKDSLDHG
jgi:DNA-binding MarR family transcriptional regulator